VALAVFQASSIPMRQDVTLARKLRFKNQRSISYGRCVGFDDGALKKPR
jgi:hypothetical protein